MVNSAIENRQSVYEAAYSRLLDKYKADPGMDSRVTMKKLLFLGVKKINSRPDRKSFTREEAEYDFQEAEIMLGAMRLLTPEEFVQMFPITKDYNGHKHSFKDYFYSRDYIQKLPQDEPIGDEILHFIWEYTNQCITEFVVYLMGCLDNLRRLEGQPSFAQAWAEDSGLKTYTLHTDDRGRKFLFDKETGRTTRVKERRHLKLIKK